MPEKDNIDRPTRCADCVKYIRDRDEPGRGWCDNWGGVHLRDEDICHPNMGRRSW